MENTKFKKEWRKEIVKYLPWIEWKAKKIARSLPYHVAIAMTDDLVGAGNRGLMEAMHRLDPDRANTADAYIRRKITCAMLDELRAQDPLSRGQRHKRRQMERAEKILTGVLGGPPTAEQMARATGTSVSEYQTTRNKVYLSTMSLDSTRPGRSDRPFELSDQNYPDSFEATLLEERCNLMRQAISKLSEPCRKVVQEYYLEGRSLKEIGSGLSVCDARVSQLRKEGVLCLRRELVQRMAA